MVRPLTLNRLGVGANLTSEVICSKFVSFLLFKVVTGIKCYTSIIAFGLGLSH